MGGERTEGGRGGAGGRSRRRYKNSKSSIPTLLFLYNTCVCPPSKHFYYHCLQYTEQICFFTSNGDAKGGKIAPFRTSLSSCH